MCGQHQEGGREVPGPQPDWGPRAPQARTQNCSACLDGRETSPSSCPAPSAGGTRNRSKAAGLGPLRPPCASQCPGRAEGGRGPSTWGDPSRLRPGVRRAASHGVLAVRRRWRYFCTSHLVSGARRVPHGGAPPSAEPARGGCGWWSGAGSCRRGCSRHTAGRNRGAVGRRGRRLVVAHGQNSDGTARHHATRREKRPHQRCGISGKGLCGGK